MGNGREMKELKQKTVLLVEDEPLLRETLKKVLERGGWEVETAADGGEGIALFERCRPDLLITDWNMPGMDGMEMCRRLVVVLRDSQTPVVVMSGFHRESEWCMQGIDDWHPTTFLRKPFTIPELQQVLESIGPEIS